MVNVQPQTQLFPTKFFDDASDDLKSFLRIVSAPCGKLTDFANISLQFEAETWLSSIVLDALIPACFDSTSIVACIAARDFATDILLGTSNSLIPLVNTQSFKLQFILDLFTRIRQCLLPYAKTSCLSMVPRITHALTLVSDLIQSSSQVFTSSVLEDTISLAPIMHEAVATIFRSSVFVGSDSEWISETIVFIFQVFNLWRRAMKAQSKLNQSDDLSHNTCIQRALLDTAELLLIRSPTAFIRRPDEDSLPPVVIVQLMLRSLRALSKSLCAFVQDAHVLTLRTQLDQLIFTISCSSTSDNTNLSPCVEFLLSELTPAVSLFQNNSNTLCGSEQTIDSLRRLLLLDLDLAWRTETSDPNLCLLLESIRIIVSRARSSPLPATYEALFVDLFTGQDNHLIHCLYLWLLIANKIPESWSRDCSRFIVNPHWVFVSLLETIGYSPHVIIDWIMSPETEMLLYLVHYLRFFRHRTSFQVPGAPILVAGTAPTSPLPSVETTDYVWPKTSVSQFFSRTLHCLQILHDHGNIPFNPSALMRGLKLAIHTLELSTDTPHTRNRTDLHTITF